MAITSLDTLISAMAGSAGAAAQMIPFNKVSVSTQTAGFPCSLWNVSGAPAAAGIPSTPAICNGSTPGRFPITAPGGSRKLYASNLSMLCSNGNTLLELHDRLGHMGGLNGTLLTEQAVNLDISGTGSDLAARRGEPDYSEVQWWLEIYTAVGTTAVNYTVKYTRADGTAGQTTAQYDQIGGTGRLFNGRLIPIITSNGALIQQVESITLAASTGTAGNFGVTATRRVASLALTNANAPRDADYAALGLPEISGEASLQAILYCGTTSSGALAGVLRVIEG